MSDAPERTLSERIREGHYFQTPTGTRYRLADEVAALEQQRDAWKKSHDQILDIHNDEIAEIIDLTRENARLREAVQECVDCDGTGKIEISNPHLSPERCQNCRGEGFHVDGAKWRALAAEQGEP